MSTSLTKKEQIYAVALGLGFLMEKRQDGDQHKIMAGLRMLRNLVDDDDHKELLDLVERGGLADSDWIEEAKEKLNEKPDMGSMMHEIPHRDRYTIIAIGMAQLLTAGAEYYTKPHKRFLKALFRKEDLKWCQDYMRECLDKCGCEECKKKRVVIDKVCELNASGVESINIEDLHSIIDHVASGKEFNPLKEEEEKQEPPVTEETWPEDPWKAFGA